MSGHTPWRSKAPSTPEEAERRKNAELELALDLAEGYLAHEDPDALQAKLDAALGLHEGDFYEQDEDPAPLRAQFEAARERGELLTTAPPEDNTITDNVAWVLWLAAERGELHIPEE